LVDTLDSGELSEQQASVSSILKIMQLNFQITSSVVRALLQKLNPQNDNAVMCASYIIGNTASVSNSLIDSKTVKILVSNFKHRNSNVAYYAIYAVKKLIETNHQLSITKEVINALIYKLNDIDDNDVRFITRDAMKALARTSPKMVMDKASTLLTELISNIYRNLGPNVVKVRINSIIEMVKSLDLEQEIVYDLESYEFNVDKTVFLVLKIAKSVPQLASPLMIQDLVEMLRSNQEPNVRQAALLIIKIIIENYPESLTIEAVEALIDRLSSDHDSDPRTTIISVFEIIVEKYPESFTKIIIDALFERLSSDHDSNVIKAAVSCIRKVGKDVSLTIVSEKIRELVNNLAPDKYHNHSNKMTEANRQQNEKMKVIVRVITKVASILPEMVQDEINILANKLNNFDSNAIYVIRNIVTTDSKLITPTVIESLANVLNTSKNTNQKKAIITTIEIIAKANNNLIDENAMDALVQSLNLGSNADVRQNVIRAIETIAKANNHLINENVMDALVQSLNLDSDASVRLNAIRTIETIAKANNHLINENLMDTIVQSLNLDSDASVRLNAINIMHLFTATTELW
jgi:hypothetical protein